VGIEKREARGCDWWLRVLMERSLRAIAARGENGDERY
jgi:hypothetical protein